MAVALAACQGVPMLPGLTPHRIDIQQGNVVTQDMVSKLKPGMTRHQVRFVMGTPPIADVFHPDRWDYVYYVSKRGKITEHRRLVLTFDGDTLKRIDGDVVVADTAAKPADKPVPEAAAEEKGFFGRMLDKIGL
jgi:outer membrane protein assembly factor BamE